MNKYVISDKVKETNIKIIHRYYSCNDFINKFKDGFRKESETIFSFVIILNYFGPKFLYLLLNCFIHLLI